jgi:hypothetical protein
MYKIYWFFFQDVLQFQSVELVPITDSLREEDVLKFFDESTLPLNEDVYDFDNVCARSEYIPRGAPKVRI